MIRLMTMLLIDHITGYGESMDYEDFEPHTEGPNYEDWNGSLDDTGALETFSGLFEGRR